jgi:hypothetical protein
MTYWYIAKLIGGLVQFVIVNSPKVTKKIVELLLKQTKLR